MTAVRRRWRREPTPMQAIARPNRVYPGKDCGVIVDYNGHLFQRPRPRPSPRESTITFGSGASAGRI